MKKALYDPNTATYPPTEADYPEDCPIPMDEWLATCTRTFNLRQQLYNTRKKHIATRIKQKEFEHDKCPYCGSKEGLYISYETTEYYDFKGNLVEKSDDKKDKSPYRCIDCDNVIII